jgi:hypothetical protein
MFVDGIVSIGESGFLNTGFRGVYPATIEASASVTGTVDGNGNVVATLSAQGIDAGLNGGLSFTLPIIGQISGGQISAGALSGSLNLLGSIDTNANLYMAVSGSINGLEGFPFSGGISAQLQPNGGFLAPSSSLTAAGTNAFGTFTGIPEGRIANNVSAPINGPTYSSLVPQPGLPPLAINPSLQKITAQPVQLTVSPIVPANVQLDTSQPGWAIYDENNNPLVTPDQFRAIRYTQNARTVSTPIEGGSFVTWNKIYEPPVLSLIVIKNSKRSDREAFEQALLNAQGTLNLYSVSIPENTYTSLTLERVEPAKRGKEQAYQSEIELFFRQVLEFESVYGDMSNAQPATATPATSLGRIQPSTPSPPLQSVTPNE